MHYQNDNHAYDALRLAIKKLNTSFDDSATKGGLENYVDFKIFHYFLQREVLFKITGDFSEPIKKAIVDAVHEEATKLRMTVGTISA
jgi:hypothetical protein